MNHILKALTLLLVFAVNFSQAQSNRYDWGIEGGPNLSTLRISETKTNSMIYGSVGFIFQYNTKKILSLKTGFSYQRKGAQLSGIYVNDDYNNSTDYYPLGQSTFSFDYISLPFLVKASFGKKVKFFVNAGPYVGFLLFRATKWTYGNEVHIERTISIFKRLDYGVAAGIGFAVPIKESWMVHAEVRNYLGAQNINMDPGDRFYTNTTDLRLGVVYRLGFRDSK